MLTVIFKDTTGSTHAVTGEHIDVSQAPKELKEAPSFLPPALEGFAFDRRTYPVLLIKTAVATYEAPCISFATYSKALAKNKSQGVIDLQPIQEKATRPTWRELFCNEMLGLADG
jgi:hypothetical protein